MIFFQNDIVADSLKQQELLLNLGPLYEPDPVSFSFETIGWKILATLILILTGLVLFLLIRRYRHNKYRRMALTQLSKIEDPSRLPEIFILIKSTAIQTFGREKVGALFGDSWLEFLDQTGKSGKFSPFSKTILKSIYSDEHPQSPEFQQIKSQASNWISTHARKL